MSKKKKIKKKNITTNKFTLKKIPSKISKFYQSYKKQKEVDYLRKIKLREREETKNILQEKKELSLRTDKIKKEEERLRLKEEELKQKFNERN